MSFGTPKYEDPDENLHVFGGVVAGVLLAGVIFQIINYNCKKKRRLNIFVI
jgi:hypothetical protein